MSSVLLLAPSRGLGGGIERYVSTVEAAFADHAVRYRRLDLRSPDRVAGPAGKLAFVREVAAAVRTSPDPVRLVLAHRNLLPVLYRLVRFPRYRGATVVFHGSEVWSGRGGWRDLALRRSDVRAVAGSNFTAGALVRSGPANVLNPGVSREWYDELVAAGRELSSTGRELGFTGRGGVAERPHLVTAFRLDQWRDKGLDALLRAVPLLDQPIRLTVCGAGPVPPDLTARVDGLPWCRVRADLPDRALAAQLADADLFVLATRTRRGSAHTGEGFGLVLLEAQLAGTPVVAPAYGGSGEAFQPGLTGVAPVDESPGALAAVIAPVLRDHEHRAELARAAAAWSRRRFEPIGYGRHIVRMLLGEAPEPGAPEPGAPEPGAPEPGSAEPGAPDLDAPAWAGEERGVH